MSGGPVTIAEQRLLLDGRPVSLHAAAVHYWRLERDRWEAALDAVVQMRCTAVSIYIPWEIHEVERGRFDFGEVRPHHDVDAFMALCEERGLSLVARPGPQINAELTWFGFPRRILEDRRLHARSAQGSLAVLTQVPRPIPAISYASDDFFAETALWYDAVCPILQRHVAPAGGLLAVQVDNEMAYFFNVNAYAADFSDASLAGYRRFLEAKTGTVASLNETYGSSYTSFAEVEPPRRFDGSGSQDVPRLADWAEYRERYLVDGIDRLAGMLRERGLDDVALFHNYPHPLDPGSASGGFSTPFSLAALEEKVDFVGFDIYSGRTLYEHVKTIVSYVAGTSRFPYAPELIAGAWPWYQDPGDLDDEEFVAKAALMHGLEGFSRYVLVERDRWMASPVRRDGRVRPDKAAVFGRVNDLASRMEGLRRRADVLVLADRDYDRLEAASVLVSFPGDFLETPSGFSEYPNALTVSEDRLGFAEPIQMAKTARFSAVLEGLSEAGHAFLISDTGVPPDAWSDYAAVVIGSYEYLNGGLQRALVAFAQDGGRVVMGPRVPHLDERMRADETLARALEGSVARRLDAETLDVGARHAVGGGSIVVLERLDRPAAAIAAALEGLGALRPRTNDPRLDVAIHGSAGGDGRLIVFVANPTGEAIAARISLDGEPVAVTEIWEDRPVVTGDGAWEDDLPPYSIHVYECLIGG